MENQKILEEVLLRSKEDPWCRECLERIQKYGATIYRTDQNGTIIFRR